MKRRIQVDGLSADAGGHALLSVRFERRCHPLLHAQRVTRGPVARRSSRREHGNTNRSSRASDVAGHAGLAWRATGHRSQQSHRTAGPAATVSLGRGGVRDHHASRWRSLRSGVCLWRSLRLKLRRAMLFRLQFSAAMVCRPRGGQRQPKFSGAEHVHLHASWPDQRGPLAAQLSAPSRALGKAVLRSSFASPAVC